MASVGPTFPGTGANDAAVGTWPWLNPSRITADDASFAAPGVGQSTSTSNYLKATAFGFAIPAGSTINGILVEWDRKASAAASDYVKDNIVKLLIAGTVSGDNLADTVNKWPTTSAYASYGGSSSLWGLTPSASDINNTNFGVVLSCNVTKTGKVGVTPSVDCVRITVYYTAGASAVRRMFPGIAR